MWAVFYDHPDMGWLLAPDKSIFYDKKRAEARALEYADAALLTTAVFRIDMEPVVKIDRIHPLFGKGKVARSDDGNAG